MIVNKSFDSTSEDYVMQPKSNNVTVKIMSVPHPSFYFRKSKIIINANKVLD